MSDDEARPERLDDDPNKTFPTSISRIIEAIVERWETDGIRPKDHKKRDLKEFALDPNFLRAFENVRATNQGLEKVRSNMAPMVGQLVRGQQRAEFYKLRAFADYVGLPPGLLILTAQLASEERRDQRDQNVNPKQRVEALAAALSRFSEALLLMIREEDAPIFASPKSSVKGYAFKIEALRALVDAFQDKQPASENRD